MESWDDDNFEPPIVVSNTLETNKWEGEDEDDEVKENWEDEEEEKEQEKGDKEAKVDDAKKKKKPLAERIAEKERMKREEMERRLREMEEEEVSPEEKLRRQKESDLKLALETTFGGDPQNSIDGLSLPNTKEEFDEFTEMLSKKLLPLSKNVEYPNFTEGLVRNLCATMTSLDIKKIKNTLDNLYLEKQKIEKGDKPKKSKGKGKARLKLEGDNQLSQLSAYVNDFDDYDDFM